MRIALLTVLLSFGLHGCAGLSAESVQAATQAAANGVMYGATALAVAAAGSRDDRAAAQPHAHGARPAEAPAPQALPRDYVCTRTDGEQRRLRARSRTRALAACGLECTCVDTVMSEELELYQRD